MALQPAQPTGRLEQYARDFERFNTEERSGSSRAMVRGMAFADLIKLIDGSEFGKKAFQVAYRALPDFKEPDLRYLFTAQLLDQKIELKPEELEEMLLTVYGLIQDSDPETFEEYCMRCLPLSKILREAVKTNNPELIEKVSQAFLTALADFKVRREPKGTPPQHKWEVINMIVDQISMLERGHKAEGLLAIVQVAKTLDPHQQESSFNEKMTDVIENLIESETKLPERQRILTQHFSDIKQHGLKNLDYFILKLTILRNELENERVAGILPRVNEGSISNRSNINTLGNRIIVPSSALFRF